MAMMSPPELHDPDGPKNEQVVIVDTHDSNAIALRTYGTPDDHEFRISRTRLRGNGVDDRVDGDSTAAIADREDDRQRR